MGRKMKNSGIEWIGEIPEDFSLKKVKHVCGILDQFRSPVTADKRNQNSDVLYDYYGASGVIDKIDGYTIDDHVMLIGEDGANLRMRNLPLLYEVNGKAWINNHAHILKPKRDNNFYFLMYGLESLDINPYITGSAQPKLNQENLKNMWIPIPPYRKQCQIADFLSARCAHIDSILNKTRTSIEEYKKLKQSIITQAVTKGIHPNRKMKDSGIEWIGEIPEEWDSMNPKALFTQRKDRAKNGERQLTASQQFGVIYQDEYMERTGTKVVTVEKDFDILKHVEMGDFVISMRSFQGGLEYSEYTGSISSAYVMLIPNVELVFPHYYKWLLKSSVYINALQSTSNMVRDGQAMRYSNFAQVRLFMVPLEEQKEIANYLDVKISKINTLISKKEQLLTELENYKKSLIFEYVTGKKEVPVAWVA